MKNCIVVLVAICAIFFPLPALATGISFSEMMFDPLGTDTGREWIRLSPLAGEEIDLKDIQLLEEGVKHKISPATSSKGILYQKIPIGKDVVIADNPQKFLQEYPDFDGALFDSVFSLKNTGEPLSLILKGNIADEFIPPVPFGESGDGRVWLKRDSGWSLGPSTIVSIQPAPVVATSTLLGTDQEDIQKDNMDDNGVDWIESERVQINVVGFFPKIQTAGVESNFQAVASGKNGEITKGVRYYWNFGNGEVAEGEKVLYPYLFPGRFAVSVTAVSDRVSSTQYKSIDIIDPKIEVISIVPGKLGWIELKNSESRFVELSGFIISGTEDGVRKRFVLPSKTFLAPKGLIRIAASTAGFSFGTDIEILYPNGRFLTR